jgi:hypothetical protein
MGAPISVSAPCALIAPCSMREHPSLLRRLPSLELRSAAKAALSRRSACALWAFGSGPCGQRSRVSRKGEQGYSVLHRIPVPPLLCVRWGGVERQEREGEGTGSRNRKEHKWTQGAEETTYNKTHIHAQTRHRGSAELHSAGPCSSLASPPLPRPSNCHWHCHCASGRSSLCREANGHGHSHTDGRVALLHPFLVLLPLSLVSSFLPLNRPRSACIFLSTD